MMTSAVVKRMPLVVAVLAAASMSVQAEEAVNENEHRFYAGANYGNSKFNDDNLYQSGTIDRYDNQWAVYGGMRILPWLSVEAQYSDLGSYDFKNTAGASLYINGDDFKAFSGAARFNYDINSKVELFAKAGLSLINLQQDFVYNGKKTNFSSYGVGTYFAAGAAYHFNDRLSVVGQVDAHIFGVDASTFYNEVHHVQIISSANIGLQFAF